MKSTLALILILTAGLLSSFQNCSMPVHQSLSADSFDFFNYPYRSLPSFYTDIQLFKVNGQEIDLQKFVFVGTVSYVQDQGLPVNFEVKIKNQNGDTLCPSNSGTLNPGTTLVTFECVSLVAAEGAQIEFSVSSNGESQIFTKIY